MKKFIVSFLFAFTLLHSFAQTPVFLCNQLHSCRLIEFNNQIMVINQQLKSLSVITADTCPTFVKQLNSNSYYPNGYLGNYIIHKGVLYFTFHEEDPSMANNDISEVWRTDGTDTGTYILNSAVHPRYCGNSYAIVNDTVFFVGKDSIYSAIGYNQIRGIMSDYSSIQTVGNLNGWKNYLIYENKIFPDKLYAWDNITGSFNQLLPNIASGYSIDDSHDHLNEYHDTLYIYSNNYANLIWVSASLNAGIVDSNLNIQSYLGRIGNKLILNAYRASDSVKTRLYSFDLATKTINYILPNGTDSLSIVWNIYTNDTVCFFDANDSIHGCELWHTDGTVANTYLCADANPGTGDSYFNFLDYSICDSTPGIYNSYLCGNSLFVNSGSVTGGFCIYTGNGYSSFSLPYFLHQNPGNFIGLQNNVYFIADVTFNIGALYKIDCNAVLSTNELSESKINIYPNPVLNTFEINSPENLNGTFYVKDILGNTIIQKKSDGMNKLLFDLSGQTSGIYILTYVSGINYRSLKLIKN